MGAGQTRIRQPVIRRKGQPRTDAPLERLGRHRDLTRRHPNPGPLPADRRNFRGPPPETEVTKIVVRECPLGQHEEHLQIVFLTDPQPMIHLRRLHCSARRCRFALGQAGPILLDHVRFSAGNDHIAHEIIRTQRQGSRAQFHQRVRSRMTENGVQIRAEPVAENDGRGRRPIDPDRLLRHVITAAPIGITHVRVPKYGAVARAVGTFPNKGVIRRGGRHAVCVSYEISAKGV